MVGTILVSHGNFVKDILQSGEMIFGVQPNVKAVTLQPSEGPGDIRAKIEEAITTLEDPEQVLFMMDLWSGAPFNQTSGLINGHEDTWTVVTRLNLSMLIEAFASRVSMESTQEIAVHVCGVAKEGVRSLLGALEPAQEKRATEPATPQGVVPEGTVIGGEHIKYVLARIDSRLLYGQVTTAQTKAVRPTRIVMVSDGVARDELRENLIEQTVPPGAKANVAPVDKMIQVAKNPRSRNTKAVLLFETPQGALRAIEDGVDVKELNIGSMARSVGKITVSKVLSLGKDDVKTFEKLKAKGIQFNVRKVPNDSKENMDDIIKRTKTELAQGTGGDRNVNYYNFTNRYRCSSG